MAYSTTNDTTFSDIDASPICCTYDWLACLAVAKILIGIAGLQERRAGGAYIPAYRFVLWLACAT
jgi:hypothetical protein